MKLAAVIMAGGAGTRFWPVSTSKRPKQFLNLFGKDTLLQQSYQRIADLVEPENIFVLTNKDFVELVAEQLPQIPRENIVGEPYRRDTAAAVALSILLAAQKVGDCTILTLTADHKIDPKEDFQKTILSAAKRASESKALYTLGITPTYPATAYGYLECSQCLSSSEDTHKHYQLKSFKEKPALELAEKFLAAGNYYWNSGMFVWHLNSIMDEFKRQQPRHLELLSQAIQDYQTPQWEESLAKAFEPLPKISIDYAIMEHALDVRTVACNFNWLDLGGWLAAAPFLDNHDENNNSYRGQVYVYQSENNIIFSDDPQKNIALVGVQNMAVIYSQGKTLVVPLNRLDEIKKLTDILPQNLR